MSPRFHSLDGLRGLASFMVAGCHFFIAFDAALLTGEVGASHFHGDISLSHTAFVILYNPELCVAIFFILSGFVLAASVSETRLQLHWLVLRRWLRLALPVIAASLFAWAIAKAGLNFAQSAAVFSKSSWLAAQYSPISLTAPEFWKLLREAAFTLWYPHGPYGDVARFYNSNLWTMPIEFAGSVGLYAVYAIVLNPWVPRPAARLFVIAVLLALLWNSPYYGFPAGAGLFELQKRLRQATLPAIFQSPPLLSGGGLLVLAVGVFAGGTPFNIDMHGDVYAPVARFLYGIFAPLSPIPMLHHFGAFCIVAGVLLFRPARAVLEHAILQFLGRISFMLYLVQIPILCSAGAGVLMIAAPRTGYFFAVMLAGAAYFPSALAAATVMTRFVDIPATKASKKLSLALQSHLPATKSA